MKLLLFFFSVFLLNSQTSWLTDFEQAKKTAVEKNVYILLNFSGSDWCGPCIEMKKQIFESTEFKSYATDHLVLLNADFPRYKRNKLNKEQVTHNETLADKYNVGGKFPFTILLTPRGDVIKTWDGFFNMKPAEFIKQITLAGETGN